MERTALETYRREVSNFCNYTVCSGKELLTLWHVLGSMGSGVTRSMLFDLQKASEPLGIMTSF